MATFTQRILTDNDDAEELDADKSGGSEGDMDLGSSDLEFNGNSDAFGSGYFGLRYTTVDIPPGSSITSAFLQFHVKEVGDNAALTATFWGEDVDDAPAFTTTAFDITNRTRTTASVDWVVPAWLAVDDELDAQKSPDLKEIIQEIISRPGWAENNDLVLIKLLWSGTGERTAESRDGEIAAAAELTIIHEPVSPVSFEQEGYRWRNDDGSESAATFRQLQDVVDAVDKAENIRLRTLLDATGDPPTVTRTLQYKRDDEPDSEYRIV
jgi:hypothetical protein